MNICKVKTDEMENYDLICIYNNTLYIYICTYI